MPMMRAETSTLLLIDFQAKLMPANDQAALTIAMLRGSSMPQGLSARPSCSPSRTRRACGQRSPNSLRTDLAVLPKMSFDATGPPGFFERLTPGARRGRRRMGGARVRTATVLPLVEAGRRVFVVSDAVGSRRPESKEIALQRLARSGAEIVTTGDGHIELALEALGTGVFKEVMALVRAGG